MISFIQIYICSLDLPLESHTHVFSSFSTSPPGGLARTLNVICLSFHNKSCQFCLWSVSRIQPLLTNFSITSLLLQPPSSLLDYCHGFLTHLPVSTLASCGSSSTQELELKTCQNINQVISFFSNTPTGFHVIQNKSQSPYSGLQEWPTCNLQGPAWSGLPPAPPIVSLTSSSPTVPLIPVTWAFLLFLKHNKYTLAKNILLPDSYLARSFISFRSWLKCHSFSEVFLKYSKIAVAPSWALSDLSWWLSFSP